MGCMGGSSSGTSKSTSTSYTPSQAKWQGETLDLYGTLIGQGQNVYEGTRVAPFSDMQTSVLEQLPGNLASLNASTEMPLYGETQGALSSLMSGSLGAQPITGQQEQDYYTKSIRDPRMKEFQQTELPGIQEAFSGPGYWGSARANETAEAYGDVGDWLGTQRAGLAWETLGRNQQIEEAQANRIAATVPQAMEFDQSKLKNTLASIAGGEEIFKLASMDQQQQQAEINSSMQKFQEGNRLTDPEVMTIMLALLGQQYQTTTQTQTGASDMSGLGSALGAGLGILMMPGATGALTTQQLLTGGMLGAGIGGSVGSSFDF